MEHEFEFVLINLPRILLELSILLSGSVLVGLATKRINLPLTVVLAVVGLGVSEFGGELAIGAMIQGEGFEILLVNLFLPILIFEAAIALNTREFMRNLVPIGALATVALAISAVLVGVSMNLLIGWPIAVALLFGVIVSATDPVAVVAIFREVGVSRRLLTLVEGESMVNDGVAIVLSAILATAAIGGTVSVGEGVVDFIVVVAGGILIGSLIGMIAILLFPVLTRLPAAALSIGVAYGSFVLAEAVLGFSGVMATVATGVLIGSMTESRANLEVREILHELWESLAFVANALLFLFIGLTLDFSVISDNIGVIAVATVAVLLARPIAVVPLVWALERIGIVQKVGSRNSAVMVWGGLRGGVALALALAVSEDVALRGPIIAATGGVVLATLLINATTIKALVHNLGLDQVSPTDQFLEGAARLFAIDKTRERLNDLRVHDEVLDVHLQVAEVDARDELARAELSKEEELRVLVMRGLQIQRETYQNLSDAGLLPPVATRTLMYEIDEEIEETEEGALRADAPRRGLLPWYARYHRVLLGYLPPPLGEDLTEVEYIEISARRLAAQKAAAELDNFRNLEEVHEDTIRRAKTTFVEWERAAESRLEALELEPDVHHRSLDRRQAQALSKISVKEVLAELVATGVVSHAVAESAGERVLHELDIF